MKFNVVRVVGMRKYVVYLILKEDDSFYVIFNEDVDFNAKSLSTLSRGKYPISLSKSMNWADSFFKITTSADLLATELEEDEVVRLIKMDTLLE